MNLNLKLFLLIIITSTFISCDLKQKKLIFNESSNLFISNNSKTNSLEIIINDIKLDPDAKPHGVPNHYEWYKGASIHHLEEVDPTILKKYNAMVAWGQTYFTEDSNYEKNIRVQVRNIKAYVLKNSDMKWHIAQSYSSVIGAAFPEDFQGVSREIDLREEPSGGVSAKLQKGRNFHFFSPQRASFDHNDDIAIFSTFQARLILDNPNLKDNIDKVKIIGNAGADPWESLSYDIGPAGIQPAFGVARFKYLTKDWQSFNMITLTEEQIRQFPPPIN